MVQDTDNLGEQLLHTYSNNLGEKLLHTYSKKLDVKACAY